MKRFQPAVLAALVLALPSLAFGEVHQFAVDPVHSEVGFKIRHLVAKAAGRFDEFSGKVWLDPDNVAKTLKVQGTVKTASINTNNDDRDNHLRSADFFEVEKYPEMTLVTKSVKKKGDGVFEATADLTLRGVTKPITLTIEYGGIGTNPFTGTPTTGLEIQGKVNRKDYGMVWNKALDAGGFVLDETVHLNVLLEATVPPAKKQS